MNNTKYTTYEQPGVTVDLVIFTLRDDSLQVLLVQRAEAPFAGAWSLPGGFLLKGETLEEAALRVLEDKTAVRDVYLEQLYTFGAPERDPRSRVITVAYFALIPWQTLARPGSPRVAGSAWRPVDAVKDLAFDHTAILACAVERLRAKAGYSNIVYGLLPEAFRLSDLQRVYEVILGHPLDKRNFRKQMLESGLLAPTGQRERSGAHRPAMLYSFTRREVVFLD